MAESIFGTPMISCQHVAHGVSPTRFPDKPDRRAAAGEPAVAGLILAKSCIGRGHPDVRREQKLMGHIPGITVNDGDQRLRQSGFVPGQRIGGFTLR